MRTRHGELDIRSIETKPDLTGYEEERSNGRVIVGHSETGACHVIESRTAKLYRKKGAEIAYLCLEKPEKLRHDGQRHETVAFQAGWHEVVTKRQYDESAQGWSKVQD
jgi:hypothetical protein